MAGEKSVLLRIRSALSLQRNRILIADRLAGSPLDDKHGPFQMIVPEDDRATRWVKMVTKISVRRAP
jgi:hypothetical protein